MELQSDQDIHRHFLVYKPYGFLSQLVNNQNRRRNKKLLSELFDFPPGTMSVGRLDEKSEGLLILTTNGKLSSLIRSDKFDKEYLVQVDGIINETAVKKLASGVEINHEGESYLTKPCVVRTSDAPRDLPERSKPVRDDRHGPTSWISISIREGKFRQVRKMTAAVGYPTLRLIRTRIANTHLGDMKPRQVVEVDEVKL
jgi:23S rRNA pseudouridine2457 synthase